MPLTKTRFVNRSGSYQFAWKEYGRFIQSAVGLEMVGNIVYVHSSGAGTTGPNTPEDAVNDIDEAVALLTANNNDVIAVLPSHTETVTAASGIDLDVAGMSLIGLGRGTNKPVITVGDSTLDTVRVNAANVLIKNIRFVSGVDSLVKMIDVNATYCTIEDCEFIGPAALEFTSAINLATTIDYLTVRRCRFEQPADPTGTDAAADTGAIFIVDSEFIFVENCWFTGNFETAIIHNRTTACKNLWVKDCWGIQDLSGAEPFQLVAGATGAMLGGGFITPAETAATEATLVGTLGNAFFILPPGNFGNDGLAGGQGGIIVATAS